jgi:hypothetical protein
MDNDWTLTPKQLAWMNKRRTAIHNAYDHRLDSVTASNLIDAIIATGYAEVFGTMGWDLAVDYYEDILIETEGIVLDGRKIEYPSD